jgi:peptide-methionine (R)-S-oxide reductase
MHLFRPSLTRRSLLAAGGLACLILPGASLAARLDPWASDPWRKLTPRDWRARLPAASYEVLRREGTERPFSSPLNDEHRAGVFTCLGCGLPLFRSQWKFNSGTGWPSFYRAVPAAVATKSDDSLGMQRTEYHCARCLGHQGHLFDDGPPPTGLRYCNNGVALAFRPG